MVLPPLHEEVGGGHTGRELTGKLSVRDRVGGVGGVGGIEGSEGVGGCRDEMRG